MSLLSPERFRLGLGASYAVLAEVKGGMLMNWRMQTWPTAASPSWQAPLAEATAWLRELAPGGAKVGVVLSAELAPLQLLPWRDDAGSAEQQSLIAAAQFRRIHGEAAAHSEIRVFPTGFGQPWLAGAIDPKLLAAITEQLRGISAAVTSIAPLPVTLFNTLRGRLRDPSGWLLVTEPQRLTALHWREGQWRLLRILPGLSLQGEPLRELLQRETRLAGLADLPARIYLTQPMANPLPADGVNLGAGWKPHASVPQGSPTHLLGGRA